MAALDLETLLAPIPGANPAGADLRYATEYDKIKTARRAGEDKVSGKHDQQDQTGPGADQDWRTVEKLASDALAKRSKDLQLGVWLLEMQTRSNGFTGAAFGLELVRELITRFWDALHPLPDDEDDEPLALRIGVMQWIEEKLPNLLKALPLTDSDPPYSLLHHEVTQETGDKKKALLEAGWPTAEQFEAALNDSRLDSLESVLAEVTACQEQLTLLGEATDATFVVKKKGSDGTERSETLIGFGRTADVLENCRWLVNRVVTKRRPQQVAVVEQPAPAPASDASPSTATESSSDTSVVAPAAPSFQSAAPVNTREHALEQLDHVIAFLLTDDASDPTPYLLSRAVAFGPLFAYGSVSEALPLPSPPTELRQRLRAHSASGEWSELAQETERYLRATPKQAWIDLQRYAVKALNGLGGSSSRIATAIEHQLRVVLAAFPDLPDAEFEDGTPTANQESKQWLDELMPAEPQTDAPARPTPVLVEKREDEAEPTITRRDEAFALANGGRSLEALAVLQELVQSAASGRERFLYKLDLAEVCLDSDRAALAYPILEELAGTIERARLEEWEDKDVVARAWTALVKCGRQLEDNPEAQARSKDVFNRLCRLDISRALSIDKNATATPSRWSRR
jgi:type VI secretion system protein ImpA